MAEDKHFRIIVDLSAFFYDHRRVARVFVKKHLKTIADLQNRISEVFEISDFFLTTGGHFLPASEDVRILSHDENVCVKPFNGQENLEKSNLKASFSTRAKDHGKQKNKLEVIAEVSSGTEERSSRKKKHKKKYVESYDECSTEDEVPCKKKKRHNYENNISGDTSVKNKDRKKQKSKKADSNDIGSSFENELIKNSKNSGIVEREICNIESSQKINDIKKKLKQKTEEYIQKNSKAKVCNSVENSSNIKNVLPKLQSHIKNCNNLGRSTLPDTVRLSRRSDTPIKSFKSYSQPPRITDEYLAKNKINIVKIDIIKPGSEESIGEANVSQSSSGDTCNSNTSKETLTESSFTQNLRQSSSPQKNYVKEVVNTFEKIISPESNEKLDHKTIKKIEKDEPKDKDTEASNYTKAFLDQNDVDVSIDLEHKTEIIVQDNNTPKENNHVSNHKLNHIEFDSFSKPEANQLDFDSASKPESNKIEFDSVSIPESNQMEFDETPKDVQSLTSVESQTKHMKESTNTSLNISSITQESFNSSGNPHDYSLNSTNTSINLTTSSVRTTPRNKRCTGIGSLLEHLRESDSVISQESDTSGQYVTKRKRIRKHKRKSKKSNELQDPIDVKMETTELKPMNVKACPSIHIKFDEDDKETLGGKSLSNDKSSINGDMIKEAKIEDLTDTLNEQPSGKAENKAEHQKPSGETKNQQLPAQTENQRSSGEAENQVLMVETMVLSDENDDPVMENKSIFGEENIANSPLMPLDSAPKVGDIIAFKVLILNEHFTPKLSNYIVGKLENYLPEKKIAYFKILRGEEELKPPVGKLLLNEELDVQSTKYKEFRWSEVYFSKLLYP